MSEIDFTQNWTLREDSNGDLHVIDRRDGSIQGKFTENGFETIASNTGELSVTNLGAKAQKTTSQTVSSATVTKVQFGTEVFDHKDEYDTTNYTFTATDAGFYDVTARFAWDTSIPGGTKIAIYIYKNGSEVASNRRVTGGSWVYTSLIPTTLELAAGDTLEVFAYQASGSAVDIRGVPNLNEFTVVKRG